MIKDYYKELELNQTASTEEIKSSFRRLIHQWHPDKNSLTNAQEKTATLIEAYEILSDSSKRSEYNQLYDQFLKKTTSISTQVFDSGEFESWRKEAKEKARTYSSRPIDSILKDVLKETAFHAGHVAKIGCFAYVAIGFGIINGIFAIKMIADGELSTEGGALGVPLFIAISVGLAYWGFNRLKSSVHEYKDEMKERKN